MDWDLGKKTSITELERIRTMVDDLWRKRGEIEDVEEEVKKSKAELAERERELHEILVDAGMTQFEGTYCVYKLREDAGVRGPQSDADWLAFKGWIRERYPEAYESFFKMNLTSLKAFVKKEFEGATKRGEFGFVIPGIPNPSPYQYLKPERKKERK